jgi:hypothetical protein
MSLHYQIESPLRHARARWRLLRVSRTLAVAAGIVALAWLALGILATRGWMTRAWVFAAGAALLLLVSFVALLVGAIVSGTTHPARGFVARQLERVHPSLLDRLNTLVWLEGRGAPVLPEGYRRRIEWQARGALSYDPESAAFPVGRAWAFWLGSFALIATTLLFWTVERPWTRFEWVPRMAADGEASEPSPKLPPPDTTGAEVKKTWGEVRITEPGHDLKVTKVDVVPLQIEAASSAALKDARYVTAVGGAKSETHPLPPPSEPHYAAYKPVVYVDELKLSDWDVVAYHAAAGTTEGKSYASEVYFLEVRPFREDILKLAGGEGGSAYQYLGELSGLIDRQKHVIRETHGYSERQYERDEQKKQDRQALSRAEGDLAEASRHLYARIASKMENKDVGVVLDELAKAEERLDAAARSLAADDPKAQPQERDALHALAATRKALQQAITDHPEAFKDADDEERQPTAELAGKLDAISEFRDEEKAAREMLDRAVARQKELAERAKSAVGAERSALSADQEKLRREVSEFAAEHPQLFKRAEKERVQADEAMRQCAGSLRSGDAGAPAAAERARQGLESLRDSVRRGAAGDDLEQAYALKKMIDGQARRLADVESRPEAAEPEQLGREAREGMQATRELKRLMDETPAGEAFGEPLHDALGPARQVQRERRLENVARAEGAEARGKAAGEARAALEQVSRAFDESQPGVTQALRKEDPLAEKEDDALDRALRRLDGLVAGAETGHVRNPQDSQRQRRQILEDFRLGTKSRYGAEARVLRLTRQLEQELTKVDLKVDPQKLRKLLEEIEQFRVEASQRSLAKKDDPRLEHVDPSKLPPAYRDRIQKYFQKLAEQ